MAKKIRAFRLLSIGPKGLEPEEFRLCQKLTSIGSETGNDFVMGNGGVSRRHASIRLKRGKVLLTDLNSSNGTLVNGVRIKGAVELQPGDELQFGARRFVLLNPTARSSERTPRLGSMRTVAELMLVAFVIGFGAAQYLAYRFYHEENQPLLAKAVPFTPPGRPVSLTKGSVLPRPSNSSVASPPKPPPGVATAAMPKEIGPASRSSPASTAPAVRENITATAALPDWLVRVNFYRSLAKLRPAVEDTRSGVGDVLHARYLVKNRLPPDSRMHDEDASNPWFTPEGLAAARGGSDVIPPCSGCSLLSPTEAIDMWITGPFHRILILNPALDRMAYGEYQENRLKAHVLSLAAPSPMSAIPPVAFPGDGSTVFLSSFNGAEWPSPLAACVGYVGSTGLPVTLELGGGAAAVVEQHRFSKDGRALEHCVFDASTYSNPVALEQNWGRNILKLYGAVVLIPRSPLVVGHRYAVDLRVSGQNFSWTFSVAPDQKMHVAGLK